MRRVWLQVIVPRGRLSCWAGASLAALGLALLSAPARAQATLPEVRVITTTPAATVSRPPRPRPARTSRVTRSAAARPQTGPQPPAPPRDPFAIERDKVPSNTQVLTASDFAHTRATNFLDTLSTALAGVSLGDQSGNTFQRDLNYRGFTASPVPGTPQGLAVYQNGVRINEAFGDVVNWSFIPETAIQRLSLVPNNPIFGLNAIGGAISIDMKTGFTYQGRQAEVLFGSYGRIQATAEAGVQQGNLSFYASADAINDHGWRDFSSSSRLRRTYLDFGGRDDKTEFHVNFTGADNMLGAVAATPVELLQRRWSSVYTWPQTTHLQLAFLTANLTHSFTDTLSVQTNVYYRGFRQAHVDGNNTDVQQCPGGPPPLLCIADGNGMTFPVIQNMITFDKISPNAFFGEIDRNWTTTNSFGGSVQAANSSPLFGHENRAVVGASIDHGRSLFTANSEVGTVDQNLFVTGTGIFIDQPAADITPVNLLATNTYAGLYATDTFEVTARLSLTAGARFNVARIELADQTGLDSQLNSSSAYHRFNPVIGATYKLNRNLTAYGGYSEANRAPTPLELGCSSPTRPCMIDNFLIADPPLKQVVSHTVEAGVRGIWGSRESSGELSAGLGAFRTALSDDILNIASTVPLFGYFQNAGGTLRKGIEAKIAYTSRQWKVYANYTYVDATYRSALVLSSPDNPFADSSGHIFVVPGDRIPGIPAHRFKAGAEYYATTAWTLGADLNVVGSQYLIHDDANQNPKVPAYAVVNLHSSYQLTKDVQLFGLVNNLFNTHYYAAGTFFDKSGFTSNSIPPGAPFLALNDPRTFVPGMPFAAYAGIRAKF